MRFCWHFPPFFSAPTAKLQPRLQPKVRLLRFPKVVPCNSHTQVQLALETKEEYFLHIYLFLPFSALLMRWSCGAIHADTVWQSSLRGFPFSDWRDWREILWQKIENKERKRVEKQRKLYGKEAERELKFKLESWRGRLKAVQAAVKTGQKKPLLEGRLSDCMVYTW